MHYREGHLRTTDLLYSILYESSAARPVTSSDIDQIVEVAVPLNRASGITGLLLYGEMGRLPDVPGHFVQWLEGSEPEVVATYDRIVRDPRHDNVRLLARGTTEALTGSDARLFPNWEMGTERLADLPATLHGFLAHVHGGGTAP